MVQSSVLTYPPLSLQDGNGLSTVAMFFLNSSLSVHIIGETYQSMEVGRRGAMSAAFVVCDEVVSNLQSWITTHDERHLSAARRGLRMTRNQCGDT